LVLIYNGSMDISVVNKFLSCLVGKKGALIYFTFVLLGIVIDLFLNIQPDALIIQIYSVIKLYMFRASSLPIIRSFLLYIRHW